MDYDSTLISFNYDCLLDWHLKENGDDKWNARFGYLFPLRMGFKLNDIELKYWSPKEVRLASRDKTIKLLKMHGSLNWKINYTKKEISLKRRLYQNVGNPQFTIIPPEWNKTSLRNLVFSRIWREAAIRINKETIFAFFGFSFVPTDLYAASLFQLSVKPKKIQKLIIVNPDKEARRRTRSILRRGISDETLVVQFDTMEEFCLADLKTLFSKKREIGTFSVPPETQLQAEQATPALGVKGGSTAQDRKDFSIEDQSTSDTQEKEAKK